MKYLRKVWVRSPLPLGLIEANAQMVEAQLAQETVLSLCLSCQHSTLGWLGT